ncbi:MAG: CHAT domain-containing tetratricopeptide repeat protein [Curvibacter sp.]
MTQEPPEASAFNNRRRDFLVARADAAEELGHLSRRLADLRELTELTRGARDDFYHLYQYGVAEVLSGDLLPGMQALQRVIELMSGPQPTGWGLVTASHGLLAYIHAELGQLDKADAHLRAGYDYLGRVKANPAGAWARVPGWEMLVLMGEGRILQARGKWAEAEAVMRRRLSLVGGAGGRLDADRVIRMAYNKIHLSNILFGVNLGYAQLARELTRQGRWDEAELTLRDLLAVNLKGSGRYALRTAQTLVQLAELLASRGRLADAERILAEAEEISRFTGVAGSANHFTYELYRARMNLAVLQQDWPGAVAAQAKLIDLFQLGGFQEVRFISAGGGVAWVRTGRAAELLPQLQRTVQERTQLMGEAQAEVAQLRGVLAMTLAALGRRADARAEYAAASEGLLDPALHDGEVQARSLQGLVRRLILEAYLDFLAEEPADSGAAAAAFRVADALHLGKTQQALTQSAARAAASQAGLGDLIRQEQDGRTEQQMLYDQLLRLAALPADQQLPQVMAGMRARIAAIDRERREAQATLERRFPAYANLVRPRSPTLEETRAVLKSDEALINILVTDAATYVWALRREGALAFVRVPLTGETIQRSVQRLRKALDPGAVDMARSLPAFDLEEAHRLYLALLQPVLPVWRGASSLLVVSNGALGQLPLALLPTAGVRLETGGEPRYANYRQVPWLLREAAFTQLPSANALVTLRRLPPGHSQRQPFIGFGDPDFGGAARQPGQPGLRNLVIARFNEAQPAASAGAAVPQAPVNWVPYSDIPPLPDTREEVLLLAQTLRADPQRDVFLGSDASKERVLRMDLTRRRVLAFATHGLLPGEFPGVDQPALALANPGQGQHGLLTLEEILGLKLDADWVVLSACNTAAGDGSGAEAVSGLGRGFFYAGTRALLATHWPVESVSARLLVTGTFANQAADPGLSRAQALRKSMLALMEQKSDAGFSYAHPLFWAPYALIGDGGI